MIYIIFFVMLIYCIIAYHQGYKFGYEDGKRYGIFIFKGDLEEEKGE